MWPPVRSGWACRSASASPSPAGTSTADHGLDNLTVIVDVNRLGQRGPTRYGWDTAVYARRMAAFGWHTIEIDGHSVAEIDRAYGEAAETTGRPTVILARTRKGRGVAAVEDAEGAHGKPLPDPDGAITELGGSRSARVEVQPPAQRQRPHAFLAGQLHLPGYEVGSSVATRDAFGQALAAIGAARADVVVLDGEVSDSTRTQYFADAHPERFFEFYIAEQQMTAAAIGMQARGWTPYLATFGAFLTRAYDFLRMASVSRAGVRVAGTHAGVSIGQDGPSQMALEDLAAFRAIHGSTVLYPCDANQTAWLTAALADREGPLERREGLKTYIENGSLIDSTVSYELLVTLFAPGTPLHDGAVIISGDRIARNRQREHLSAIPLPVGRRAAELCQSTIRKSQRV